MKALILCNAGIEAFVEWELSQFGVDTFQRYNGGVEFKCESFDTMFAYAYKGQSPSGVFSVIGSFALGRQTVENITKGVESCDFTDWLGEKRSIAVRSDLDPLDTSRQDIEAQIGAYIVKKTSCSVDLSDPEVPIYVKTLGDMCFVCVDLCKTDLAKRDYRLFFGRENIKAPIAAFAVWKAQAKKGDMIIDPFCRNGMISIEAVHLFTKRSVNYYQKDKFAFVNLPRFKKTDFDSLFAKIDSRTKDLEVEIHAVDDNFQHISSAKKNSKIAGVEKQIHFSRTDCEWLDTKFSKQSVSHMISFVPQVSKSKTLKKVEKNIREFFYQASFVLKEDGKVIAVTRDANILDKFADQYKFKQVSVNPVSQGADTYLVCVYSKSK